MKNFKKLFSIVAIVAMMLTTVPTATLGAASYSAELEGAYDYAYGIGITTQGSIETANMYGTLIRSHMAKMMVNYAKEVKGLTPDTSLACEFTDVANETAEMKGYITEACQMGLMGQGITAFNPNGVVTRAQFGTVLSRVLYGDANDGGDPYYADHLQALKDAGIMTKIDNPNAPEVRGYVMLMMQRADEGAGTPEVCQTPENVLSCSLGLDTCPAECVTNEVKEGTLNVSLSSNNPDATDVPLTSAYTTYLKFNLSSSQDVVVRSMDVMRKGLGNSTDFDKVWIENDNGVVVAKAKSLSSSDTVTLSFLSNYTVKSSEKLVLAASHKATATAGNLNYFAVTAIDTSAATVSGLPVQGNNMRISSYQAAQLVFTDVGSDSQLEVGAKQSIIGEFKLQENQASNNKDVELVSIRLKNVGTEKLASLENLKLYNDGDLVSDEVSIDGEYVTFSFENGLTVKDGLSKNFTVKADVIEGRDANNIILGLKASYDLKALETTTGIGVAIDPTSIVDLSTYEINAGKFNISSDTTNPVAGNVSLEQTNVTALVAKLSLDQAVTVNDGIKVYLDPAKSVIAGAATSAALKTEIDNNFRAVKLYVNGKLIDTVDSVSYTTTTNDGVIEANEFYYAFENAFELKTNDVISVKFDVRSTSTATISDAIALNIEAAKSFGLTASTVEYADGNTVAVADRVGTVNGNAMTIKSATLTLSDNSGYGATTKITVGTNNAKLAKFIVNAGSASSATVKRLKFLINTADVGILEYQEYTSLTLKVDGVVVGSMVNATQDTTAGAGQMFVTFDGLNVNIAKSAQKTFEVYGNVSNNANAGAIQVTVLGSAAGSTVNDQSSNPINFANAFMNAYAISAAGSMTTAKDGTSPASKILLANTTEQTVGKYKFQATDEAIDLTDLYFANNYVAGGNTIETAADARFGNFKLYVGTDTTPIAMKSLIGGKLVFEDLATRISVPANGNVVLTLKADVNSVTQADQSNAQLKVALYAAKAVSKARGTAIAVAGIAATDTFADATSVAADLMVVRKSVPTFATQALGTTKLTAGEQTIYKMTATADAAGDIEISAINFDIIDSASAIASMKLFIDNVEQTTQGAFVGNVWTFAAGQELLVGNSPKTIELKATLLALAVGDYVSTSLKQDAAFAAGNTAALAAGNIVWSDLSGAPHSNTTLDWFNGYKVPGLDTVATTLEK